MRLGTVAVGIRANTDEVADALRTRFSPYVSSDDVASPHYSIRIEPAAPDATGPQPLHQLFEGCTPIVSHRSATRPWATLRMALGGLLQDGQSDHLLRVRAQLMTHAGDAIILPASMGPIPSADERRLAGDGWRWLESRVVRIDPETGRAVVPPPLCGQHDTPSLTRGESQDQPLTTPPPGAFRIRGWVIGRAAIEVSRARALIHLMDEVIDRSPLDARRSMGILAAVLEQARVTGRGGADTHQHLEVAAELLADSM